LTLVGSQTNKNLPGVANEGYGGWTWASFVVLTSSPDSKHPFSKFMYKKENGFVFDLHEFLKKYNNGKMPDVITFQLGGNDIFSAEDSNRKYRIAETLENADRLIGLFRKQAPDVIIGVGFVMPSATSQDAFGIHYKCGQTMWGFTQSQFRLNQAMAIHFAEKMKTDKKLFLIPMQVNLDRDHNFPTMEEAVNHGNSKKIIRQCNGLHPAAAGYSQMGDTLYAWLKYQLSQQK
jgi:lysophospholipase L1-like esterase